MADIEEEEVKMEVEAVESVYGDNCIVLNTYPPHLHLLLTPRTADVHSRQFVEATIELRAGLQYPSDPPSIDIIGSKGLDEKRQKHLSTKLHDKAHELASCSMLVALCEEAVETLSSMNHPEGDCPLCLFPLVSAVEQSQSQPFMKLMSCFHCFHCECIMRWLKWVLRQNETNCGTSTDPSLPSDPENQLLSDLFKMMRENSGNCPVCRKVFLAKDIEHVLNSVVTPNVTLDLDEEELGEELLKCPLETSRREIFEAILELQQQRGGLIEPPKDNILFSRLTLQDLEGADVTDGGAKEQQEGDQFIRDDLESSGSSTQTRQTRERQRVNSVSVNPVSSSTHTRPSTNQHRRSGPRRDNRNNSRVQAKVTHGGAKEQQGDQVIRNEESSGSSTQTRQITKEHQRVNSVSVDPASSSAHTRPSTNQHRRSGPRKHGGNNSRVQAEVTDGGAKVQQGHQVIRVDMESSGSSSQTQQTPKECLRVNNISGNPASSGDTRRFPHQHQYSGPRKHGSNNSRVHAKQWSRKVSDA